MIEMISDDFHEIIIYNKSFRKRGIYISRNKLNLIQNTYYYFQFLQYLVQNLLRR